MPKKFIKEKILFNQQKGFYFPDGELRHSQAQELYDEILQLQKEFSSLIYLQKDLQRDL